MTVKEAAQKCIERLKAKGIETAVSDGRLIVMKAAGLSKIELFTRDNEKLKEEEEKLIEEMLLRREKFEPMQYIFGKCEFMGIDFSLNKDTLIPRADTEVLVECMLEKGNGKIKSFLDIGTGSGAIAVSYLKYDGNAKGEGIDISENALKAAKKNAEDNGVGDRAVFYASNLFENVGDKKFDAIISNPPYIERDIIETLEKQVKDYEPRRALNGGKDGLDFYRKIIGKAEDYLNNNGMLFFEIGYNQGEAVSGMMTEKGYNDIEIRKDLAGLDRVVFGVWKGKEN